MSAHEVVDLEALERWGLRSMKSVRPPSAAVVLLAYVNRMGEALATLAPKPTSVVILNLVPLSARRPKYPTQQSSSIATYGDISDPLLIVVDSNI